MIQTQILLTEEKMAALEELAKKRHISASDLIQESIDSLLRSEATPGYAERKQRALAVAGRFRSGLGNLSKRHDDYLAETDHDYVRGMRGQNEGIYGYSTYDLYAVVGAVDRSVPLL